MNQPNPFAALAARFEVRIDLMFADIGPDTPVTQGIRAHGNSLIDLIDGAVHAIQKLERQLLSQDRAA